MSFDFDEERLDWEHLPRFSAPASMPSPFEPLRSSFSPPPASPVRRCVVPVVVPTLSPRGEDRMGSI